MFKINLATIIFIIYFQVCSKADKNKGSMSPPNISITKFESCRGPKRRDCCDYKVGLRGDSELTYDLNVKENIEIKGKIVGISNGIEILRFPMKKPCNNLFLKTMFCNTMNVTENCVIPKGHYKFHLNVLEMNTKHNIGIYTPALGNITFKSAFYSDQCNFMCVVIDLKLKK